MRAAAVTYSDRLQDFICTQETSRSTRKPGSDAWKRVDVQEQEVAYFAHQWHYTLLSVNGKSVDSDKRIKKGLSSSGEFGGTLQGIFDPKVNAEFSWDHDEVEEGEHVCIFRYRVSQETSTVSILVDSHWTPVAHHGYVYAACDSGAVLRIHTETEPQASQGSHQLSTMSDDVRYAPTSIRTETRLLPISAETTMVFKNVIAKSEIQFRNYHRFQTESKITVAPDAESTAAPSEQQKQTIPR